MSLPFSKILVGSIFIWLAASGCGKPDMPEAVELAYDALPDEIDYNFHVKPILSDRCFKCHGPDAKKREADMRLDTPEGAFAALKSGRGQAIVSGKPGQSQVYHRILSQDPDFQMPPPESNLALTDHEKAMLIKWIDQGAEYKPHWAFIAPTEPALPKVKHRDQVQNPVDQFVLHKLEQKGFTLAPQAEKTTLIRRLSFDLTGLPPTLEQIDSFLADNSPDAYEKLVDKYLNHPAYGERMATDWLDLARYSDSFGYQDDGMRDTWFWRDWVIKAFNRNMPYDEFITWQLAGDLLPDATPEQILASGFNRNHPQTQEGGVIPEEYRIEYVADRTNTFGKAFLGLTMECARCHDHKYDPVSQKEYFQMFSFFNSFYEVGQIPYVGMPSPTLILKDEKVDSILAFLENKAQGFEQNLQPSAYEQDFEKWLSGSPPSEVLPQPSAQFSFEKYINNDKGEPLLLPDNIDPKRKAGVPQLESDKPKLVAGKVGKGLEVINEGQISIPPEIAYFERNTPFTLGIWVKLPADSVAGPIFSRSFGIMDGFRGFELMLNPDRSLQAGLVHVYPANAIKVNTKETLQKEKWTHLALVYDGSSRAEALKIYIDGQAATMAIETDHLLRSIRHYGKEKRNWTGWQGRMHIGRRDQETIGDLFIDEFTVFDRQLSELEIAQLAGQENVISAAWAQKSNAGNRKKLQEYYLLSQNKNYISQIDSLTAWRGKINEVWSDLPEAMVSGEMPVPRPTYILDRGAYDAPTTQVFPGTPESLLPLDEKIPANRLGLTQWLLDPRNPLPARVTVNRLWQMVFGQGIVSTSDDLGNQGALPTHPELLDWLALRFIESGWDIKAALKMMVMSGTYRQSSVASPQLLEQDPLNEWLGRAPSYRLPAEMIRDNALAASGILNPKIGGPSVYPYQPEGLWEQLATRNAVNYVQQHGDSLYRRSLYTIWKRTSPPPNMISLDAPERNFCTVRRQKTSTPLQALILLNDPQFAEAGRMLAEFMVKLGGTSVAERIQYGFRRLTSRPPDDKELSILQNLFNTEYSRFQSDPTLASEVLTVGEFPADTSLAPAEVAAYAVLASTLLSFDEVVIKR